MQSLTGSKQPISLDKKGRRRQWKKLILVLKKDDITRHLEEAGRLNTFLARLTEQNQTISSTCRVSYRSTKHYMRVRSHAIDLYEILRDRFPTSPSCNCILRHDVNMKLEFRNAKATAKALRFHALFTSDTAFSSPRNWQEIETEPWESKEANICQDIDNHTRVKFAIDSPSSTKAPNYEHISDLCATIVGPMISREWMGFITSDRGRQHRIRAIYHQPSQLSSKSIDTVSLAQILHDRAFRQEQRSRLGLKLASSVMQLHTTEWLTDHWNKHDILFLRSLDGKVDFDSPFIRRSFGTRNMNLASKSESVPKLHFNASIPCLFSLGIVLLELWYRGLFEDQKNEEERKMVCITHNHLPHPTPMDV